MNNTTGNAVTEGLFIAGIAAGLVSLYHIVKFSLKTWETEKPEPQLVARRSTPIIHIGFQQAHEFAAADTLVDGDLIVEGGDIYRVSRVELQGGGSEIMYGRCYPFDE